MSQNQSKPDNQSFWLFLAIGLALVGLWAYWHYSKQGQQQELIQQTYASALLCEGQSPALKIAPSVVQVRAGTRGGQVQGSGFIVDSVKGYVITATHVLAEDNVFSVTFDNGVSKSARWVAEEGDADISLLSVEPTAFPSLFLESKWSKHTLSQEKSAVAVGWAGDTYSASNGSVLAVQKDNAGWLKIAGSAPSKPGMSGGPLVNRCGKLLGILTKGDRTGGTIAVALDKAKVDRLINFAEENRAVKPTPVPTAVPTPTQASPTPMPTPTPIPPTPIPTPVVGSGSEEALRGRSEERFHAYSTGTWHEVYEYKSPRFRRMCPKSTYVARIEAAWDIWRVENLQEEDVLKARVIQVEVHGNEGQVIIDWVRNGSEIFIAEYDAPYRWVFVDGRWWDEPETWQTDC